MVATSIIISIVKWVVFSQKHNSDELSQIAAAVQILERQLSNCG